MKQAPMISVPSGMVRDLIRDLELLVDAGEGVRVGGMYFDSNGNGPMPVRQPVPISVLSDHARRLRDIEAKSSLEEALHG